MSQILSYSSVVETGTYWSSGSNVQTQNGVYAVCTPTTPPFTGNSGWLKIALTNPTDPQDDTSHVVLVRAKRDSAPVLEVGSASVEVSLRESGVERDNYTFSAGTTDADFSNTLTTGEASNISNYSNLEIWIRVNFTAGSEGGNRTISVDFLKLTIPSLAVPAQVTGVGATDGTYTDKVRISWSAAARADDYNIWRHTSDNFGAATKIKDGDAASPYDDTTANPGQTYFFWVVGSNSSGVGPESSSNSGYVQPTPSAGTGALIAGGAVVAGTGVSGSTGTGALVAAPPTLFGFGTNYTGGLGASMKTWNLKASYGD